MSDSELSTPSNLPADSQIEQALRNVVRDALKANEVITTNLARSRAERDLGLDAGFLKNDGEWKKRSKDIISAAVEEPESPEKPKTSAPKAKPAAKASAKRKSNEPQPAKKRQKKADIATSSETVVADEEDEGEAPAAKSKKNSTGAKKAAGMSELVEDDENDESKVQNDAREESALSEPQEDTAEAAATKATGKPAEDSESEMSVLIDNTPPKKKRPKKSTSPSATKETTKETAKPAKPAKELTPDEEEIKRLQGWLVKCGIRKVWGVEMKKYETPKAKIKHLKSMLDDVGMTGRYSVEKASQIREARELEVEIEAAKEFNNKWGQEGTGSGDDDGEGGEGKMAEEKKPQKRRPKGLIDFGDSGDEE
ncbi:hypothetical protein LTR08_003295 [Meristemomyces frigidus]|nr:hypothetical protein LTR08_003295 [Meristemomyces frigidus]